eukprot:6520570-Prorocentrum_lima.AAC.1
MDSGVPGPVLARKTTPIERRQNEDGFRRTKFGDEGWSFLRDCRMSSTDSSAMGSLLKRRTNPY